jgi:hypothetical protein
VANWTNEIVASPATRSSLVAMTRSAIFSSATANVSRVVLSPRMEEEKSKSSTTSDGSGTAALAAGAKPPATRSVASTIEVAARTVVARRLMVPLS